MPSVRQRAETNKRDRTNREENCVTQEQDRKPNWKNKQTRKISKELNKENMWLPYPAFESSPGAHLPDLWTRLRSVRHLLFEKLSWVHVGVPWKLVYSLRNTITEKIQSQTTAKQMKKSQMRWRAYSYNERKGSSTSMYPGHENRWFFFD